MTRNAITLNILAATFVVAYFVVAYIHRNRMSGENRCREIVTEISDNSPYLFITDSVVKLACGEAVGKQIDELDIYDIERNLRNQFYVDSAEVFTNLEGELVVKIWQNEPLVRVISEEGYDFYLDSTLKILPPQKHLRADLPVVSGKMKFDFEKKFFGKIDHNSQKNSSEFLGKIINFVRLIDSDEFLRNFIVQVYVDSNGEVELIPRVGEQVILFGKLNECREKLEKLKIFYQKSMASGWWQSAKTVNVRYKQQVIVW